MGSTDRWVNREENEREIPWLILLPLLNEGGKQRRTEEYILISCFRGESSQGESWFMRQNLLEWKKKNQIFYYRRVNSHSMLNLNTKRGNSINQLSSLPWTVNKDLTLLRNRTLYRRNELIEEENEREAQSPYTLSIPWTEVLAS